MERITSFGVIDLSRCNAGLVCFVLCNSVRYGEDQVEMLGCGVGVYAGGSTVGRGSIICIVGDGIRKRGRHMVRVLSMGFRIRQNSGRRCVRSQA